MNIRYDALDKLFYLLEDPKKILNVMRTGKFSAASYIMCSRLSNVIDSPDLIIDVGANVGQFSSSAANFFPKAEVHSFEPIPECYQILLKNTEKLPNIKTYNFAVGSSDKNIQFFINADVQSSSALKTSELRLEIFPDKYEIAKIEVEQKCLDTVYAGRVLGENCLLKMDVQGLEVDVLKGAVNSLSGIRYVLLEAAVQPMYEGEVCLQDMITFTENLGFKLRNVIQGSRSPTTKTFIEFDLLFEAIPHE
jgi:FkbM family methyltransferase